MSDPTGSDPLAPETRASAGRILGRLRRQAGLSGSELARRTGMSQSRVSRIENGRAPVTPDDLRTLAAALDLSDDVTRQLLHAANGEPGPVTALGHDPHDVVRQQSEIARIEASARVLRVYAPGAVVGLLQTSEYARRVLSNFRALISADGSTDDDDVVLRSLATRIERQQILADPARQFRFVMQEAVLSNKICPPAQMLAQLQRIREVVRQNYDITVAFVPLDTSWWPPTSPDFTIYDDNGVLIDLPHSAEVITDTGKVAVYRRLFETIEKSATTDIDPILDRYIDMYYALARPRHD